jgi:hypothetical protein
MVQSSTNNGALGAIVGMVVASNSRNLTMYSDLEEFDRNLVFYRPTDRQHWIYRACPGDFLPNNSEFPRDLERGTGFATSSKKKIGRNKVRRHRHNPLGFRRTWTEVSL